MANEDAKERLGLEDQIRSIQEATKNLAKEHSSIMGQIVDDQTRAMEAAAKKELIDKNMLGSLQAMEKVDAVRAMMAESIAEGTLDTFDLNDKLSQIQLESRDISIESFELLLKQSKQLKDQLKFLDKKDIFGKSEADRLKVINDRTKENTNNIKQFLATTAGISDEFFTLSTLAKAVGVALLNTAVESYKLGRGLSTGNQAMDSLMIGVRTVGAQIKSLGKGFMLTGDEARAITTEIVMLNGALDDATSTAISQVGELTVVFGVATGEAANLHKMMKAVTDSTDEGASAMQTQIRHLAKAHGVAPTAVMQDIAGNAMEFARFGKDGAAGLVNAAANARKLGLNLEKVVGAGDALLDVQSSIKNEMKAEMMIGRQLNLDAARAAAVAGDRNELVKQIAQQAGTLAEFNQMSVPQQRALAAALGVQVGDVTKILQAKAKGVNLDAKVLDNQSKQLTESEKLADNMNAVTTASGGIFNAVTASIPALAGLSQMTGKSLGGMKDYVKGMFGGSKAIPKPAELPEPPQTDKLSKVKGGGVKKSLQGLAAGLRSMGKGTFKGILALALAGPALVMALPSIPFLLFMGLVPLKQLFKNFSALGRGLAAFGNAAANPMVWLGVLLLGALGLAMIPFGIALGKTAPFVEAFGKIIIGVFAAMPPIIEAVGRAFEGIIGALGGFFVTLSTIEPSRLFGIALALMPLGAAGLSLLIGVPGFLAGGFALGYLAKKLTPLLEAGDSMFNFGKGISMLAASGPGLIAAGAGMLIAALAMPSFGIGLMLLAAGLNMFAPVAEMMPLIASSLAIMIPPLAMLAPLGEGLVAAGYGVMMLGTGMLPLAFAMAMLSPFIPLMPILAAALVVMTPPLVGLAAIAEVMPLIGVGFMSIGLGLIPFAMGMAMLAPYIPLMPTMAASLVIMTPPLIQLSTIADVLPTMGMGFMMLGMGLQSFAIAMAMIFPFQAVLPILAQTMVDLAPPLIAMAPLGPQIMYLASAIGALGIASAIATIPLYTFAAASYFAAPAVTLLGEASKILGAGLEMVRVPLLAMAQQAPQILLLSTGIMALGVSLLAATPPLFAFGAGAWFAMVPVLALASGLQLMVLTADGLTSVGMGLSSIAAGLSEISQFSGTIALLAIAAPALALLGGIGMLGGNSGSEDDKQVATEKSNEASQKSSSEAGYEALLTKIDTLITAVNSKNYEPILTIDGRKVGQATARKRGPKGMGD